MSDDYLGGLLWDALIDAEGGELTEEALDEEVEAESDEEASEDE